MSDERDAKVVELAVQAAGTADGKWNDRVVSLVPRVAALFREPQDANDPTSLLNTARKVAEAHVFTAEYRDHELDDEGRDGNQATQRIFVRVFDEKHQDGDYLDADGCQTLRTEPMWSASGRSIRRVLEGMQSGQRAVFYRYTEQVGKTKKMGLLIHVEPLRMRTRADASDQGPPPGRDSVARQAPDGSPAGSSGAAPSSKVLEDLWREIGILLEGLGGVPKVRAAKACRDAGYANFVTPDTEEAARAVIQILKEDHS